MLVVDAAERAAVAACECLARAGYRVGTASSQTAAPAGWSRFSGQRFSLPNPRADSRGFAERLAQIAGGGEYATLLPCSEGSLWAISAQRDTFVGSGVNLGLPAPGVLEVCTGKPELADAAVAVGLSIPDTILCRSEEEAQAAAERLRYPVMCKPRRTVFTEGEEVRHLASATVADREALDARLAETGLPCVVQRREGGPVVSFGGVMAGGRLIASAFSRYLRTWPLDAGSASFSTSLEAPRPLAEAVALLVARLGWEGIFELEMIDRGGGDYAVIDFNPRIYGSLALAVKAGAPLPAIWCDWLLEGSATPSEARPGVHYRWEDGELRGIWASLRGGRPGQALSILRPRRSTAHAYFRWNDPLPAVVRALKLLR